MTTEDSVADARCIRSHSVGDLLRRSAARFPDKIAVVYRDQRLTYRELEEQVHRVCNALAARGMVQGERVALLSHNNLAFVVLVLALARLGVILVPINFMLKAEEVAHILEHAQIRGLVVEDTLLPVALPAVVSAKVEPLLRVAILDGNKNADSELPAGWESFDNYLRHENATPVHALVGDDEVLQILYTSGTESRPKGAMLSSRSLIAQYTSCMVDADMSGEDVEVHALPLFHCAQLHDFLMPGLYLGATNIILPGADPAAMLEAVERERATKLFCPPTVWISMLRHPDFDRRDLSTLVKGYFGASAMPAEIILELKRRLPELRLYNLYGQTEMSPLATVLKPQYQLSKLGSVGRPCINVETAIVDEDCRPLPPGEIGEIVHRGPHVMLGYWNDPARTAEAFQGGWFHSGDLGVLDEEGFLRVVDRKKDMIKTGGENVASRDVEEVMYRHPCVAEVAVFGLPHPHWIEAVTAAVVLRDGQQVDEASLIDFCRDHLAGFKVPKKVVLVASLPKNASGKILKRDLRRKLSDAFT